MSDSTQRRAMRACMVCSIVLPKIRFKKEGCPNCEEYLHLQGSEEAVEACTSSVFEGLIAMADPSHSWVAKWQRIDGYVKGIYATKVMGQLPEEVITSLEEEYRIRYIPYVYDETLEAQKKKAGRKEELAKLVYMLTSFVQTRWKCYRCGLKGPYREGDKTMKPFGLG